MDYKNLLIKYIQHVGECEGVDFIDRIGLRQCSDVSFSQEEIDTLNQLSNEYKEESL